MTHTTAIKDMMKSSKMSQTRLGELLSVARSAVCHRINDPDIRLTRLLRIAEACGYEVILQPATQGKRREGQLVLRSSDYEEAAK